MMMGAMLKDFNLIVAFENDQLYMQLIEITFELYR